MAQGSWPSSVGERISGTEYVLEEPLGTGRFTQAVRVRAADGARLVLKTLLPHLRGAETLAERMLREARLFASFEHEHVLAIVDVGRLSDGRPFYAMPCIDGRLLSAELLAYRPPLPLDQALAIGAQVASGLAAVHAAGAIHRSVHPGNVVLAWTGHAWLAEIGLSDPDRLPVVTTRAELYLEPPVRPGTADDPRGDLFALGSMLYELCGGALPYPARDRQGLADRFRSTDPVALGSVLDGAPPPPALAELLSSLVARNPAARPASAWSVCAGIRTIAGQLRGYG